MSETQIADTPELVFVLAIFWCMSLEFIGKTSVGRPHEAIFQGAMQTEIQKVSTQLTSFVQNLFQVPGHLSNPMRNLLSLVLSESLVLEEFYSTSSYLLKFLN